MRDKNESCLNGKFKRNSEELAGETSAVLSRELYEFHPEGFLTGTFIHLLFQLQFSYSQSLSTIAEKLFLRKHTLDKGLQFTVDDLIQPVVSLSNLSSEEEMEVDDPSQAPEEGYGQDKDI